MLDVHYRTNGMLSITIEVVMIPPMLVISGLLAIKLRTSSVSSLCKNVVRNCHFVVIVIVAVLIPYLVIPEVASGLPVTRKLYQIRSRDLLDSRKLWHSAKNDSRDLEAMHLAATSLAYKAFESNRDSSLDDFLARCKETTEGWLGRFTVKVKRHISFALQKYRGWSRTDAFSAVDFYELYAFSGDQVQRLFEQARNRGLKEGWKPKSLIDVGAGKGTVTELVRKSFGLAPAQVYVLETSAPLRESLASRGFHASTSFEDISRLPLVDLVSLLNVLDRCDDPSSIIRAALDKLHPDGVMLVGIVLPFCSVVYEGRKGLPWGTEGKRNASSPLNVHENAVCDRTQSFEFAAAAFVAAAFAPFSLDVVAWTRLPYMSSGDLKGTHYHLDMALFVVLPGVGRGSRVDSEKTSDASVQKAIDQAHERTSVSVIPQQCKEQRVRSAQTWLSNELASMGLVSWGEVLDAGTGYASMCWLLRQQFHNITGVTAEASDIFGLRGLTRMISNATSAVTISEGNWRDDSLLAGRSFDVVVSDYLLGAIEFHWPHGGDAMLHRLLDALKPGGYLLVVGLEPYESTLDGKPREEDAALLEIEAIGDAAALLANRPTYRELPEEWVVRQIRLHSGIEIIATKQFPLDLHFPEYAEPQLSFAEREVNYVASKALREAFVIRTSELREQAGKFGKHQGSHDYAILARKSVLTSEKH